MPIYLTEPPVSAELARQLVLSDIAQQITRLLCRAYTLAGDGRTTPGVVQAAYIQRQAERLVTAQIPSAEPRAKAAADRKLADQVWAAIQLVRDDFGRPMDPVTHSALRQVADSVSRLGSDAVFGAYEGVLERWGQR